MPIPFARSAQIAGRVHAKERGRQRQQPVPNRTLQSLVDAAFDPKQGEASDDFEYRGAPGGQKERHKSGNPCRDVPPRNDLDKEFPSQNGREQRYQSPEDARAEKHA